MFLYKSFGQRLNWVEKTNTGQWQIFEVNKYAAEVAVVVAVVVVVVVVVVRLSAGKSFFPSFFPL